MKKRIIIAILAMCSGLILGGCGKQNSNHLAEQEIAEGNKAEESEQDIEETEDVVITSDMQVGIFFSDQPELKTEAQVLQSLLEEEGMGVEVFLAEDSDEQVRQLSEYMEGNPGYVIMDPIDSTAPASVLDTYSENETTVIAYRELIMDTLELDYYFSYDVYEMGNIVGQKIIDKLGLEKEEESQRRYTIEYFMGKPDTYETLFFYNGVQDDLVSYMESDVIQCLSGQTSFGEVSTWQNSPALCAERFADLTEEYYRYKKTPDIIVCGFEEAASAIISKLEEKGLQPGSEGWPLIIGYGDSFDTFQEEQPALAASVVEDENLSEKCVEVIRTLIKGEKPEKLNYSKVDNHKKLIYTGFGDAHIQEKEVIAEETSEGTQEK